MDLPLCTQGFSLWSGKATGQSFEHRRQWIEGRILILGQIFAIDICAYAVMSNHYHFVLHSNNSKAQHWSDLEVCQRLHALYKGTLLTQKFLSHQALDVVENREVLDKIAQSRLQLCDVSWFMRALNEPIARQSNEEDKCTGKFWEARFTSQALLDKKAVAACMAYVDLNPIRAKMADKPEASDHTSIQQRILARATHPQSQAKYLYDFVGNPRESMLAGLPFKLDDYLSLTKRRSYASSAQASCFALSLTSCSRAFTVLVHACTSWTGRIIREGNRGAISNQLPPNLDRLDIDPKHWLILTTKFER